MQISECIPNCRPKKVAFRQSDGYNVVGRWCILQNSVGGLPFRIIITRPNQTSLHGRIIFGCPNPGSTFWRLHALSPCVYSTFMALLKASPFMSLFLSSYFLFDTFWSYLVCRMVLGACWPVPNIIIRNWCCLICFKCIKIDNTLYLYDHW